MSIYNAPHWFPEQLSTSRDIELYSACNYKWFLSRVLHYYKYAKNVDLEAGGEFAKANEITRNAYFKQNLPMEEAVALGVHHLETVYAENFAKENFQDVLKTPSKMVEVFKDMYKQTKLDEMLIIPFEMEDGTLSVEQDFTIPLPFNHPETGKPLLLKCVLDLLGTKDGIVFVMDDKTCKSVNEDRAKQTDLLRTQNQFVQYVTVGNLCKDRFGGLDITHVRINRCKIKKQYAVGENVVEPYEFEVDVWFQQTWWNNLLYLVADMLSKYSNFNKLINTQFTDNFVNNQVVYPRAYGQACTSFFKPCPYTYHCTSGNAQDLQEQGFKQVICNTHTKGVEIPVHLYRKHVLENVPLDELITQSPTTKEQFTGDFDVDNFINNF